MGPRASQVGLGFTDGVYGPEDFSRVVVVAAALSAIVVSPCGQIIGAAQQWAKLQVIVFDLAPCATGGRHVGRTFPPADLHFYSQIYHDWPPDKCRLLTRKASKNSSQAAA